jgi:hypothetical protein
MVNETDPDKVVGNCDNFNSNIVNIVHLIIVIIIITLLFIFLLNILNYVLYNLYCIRDVGDKYIKEDVNTKLQDMYKHRLLNYVKNFDIEKYNFNIKYDTNSSDLYIHNINAYFNYLVKLLSLIIIFILIGIIYNIYYIFINSVHRFKCTGESPYNCKFLITYIYEEQPHIYYLCIIIFLCIYGHSFIYTYLFNNMVYQDLYNLYKKDYEKLDIYVKKKIRNLNVLSNAKNTVADKTSFYHPDKVSVEYENTSKYSDQLMEFSFYKLDFRNYIINKTINETTIVNNYNKLIEDGLSYNLKFIIPDEKYNDINDINDLLKNICNIKGFSKLDYTYTGRELDNKKANKETKIIEQEIFIYLVYHFVISHNMDDPFIIHKLNNIFFNIFENIKNKYKKEINALPGPRELNAEEQKAEDARITKNNNDIKAIREKTTITKEQQDKEVERIEADGLKREDIDPKGVDDGDKIIETLNYDIKKMYREIICSYSLKLLLPDNITRDYVENEFNNNAKLIVDYTKSNINKKNTQITPDQSGYDSKVLKSKIDDAFTTIDTNLQTSIKGFAENFFQNFKQENDDKLNMSKIVYKLNVYLVVDMFYTAIFIILILLILFNLISTKYPSIKPLIINMITFVYIIIVQMF